MMYDMQPVADPLVDLFFGLLVMLFILGGMMLMAGIHFLSIRVFGKSPFWIIEDWIMGRK